LIHEKKPVFENLVSDSLSKTHFSGCVQGVFQISLTVSIITDNGGGDDCKSFDSVDDTPPSVHDSDDGTDHNEVNNDI
jgi:hypothetical protein